MYQASFTVFAKLQPALRRNCGTGVSEQVILKRRFAQIDEKTVSEERSMQPERSGANMVKEGKEAARGMMPDTKPAGGLQKVPQQAGASSEEAGKAGLRFAIHTLGCRVNTYESDAIAQAMRAAGFSETGFSEPADVYIVNTCTVTNVADKKSRQMLHRAKKLNPAALVVAAGCYVDAALQNAEMQAVLRDAAVDLLVPNREKPRIAELVLERLKGETMLSAGQLLQNAGAGAAQKNGAVRETAAETGKRSAAQPFLTELDGHTRAFVKVQDGCNQFCSYCIIPYVRGRICSRPIADCVEEIRRLSENGVKEVVLTGIHLSSYGKDWERRETVQAVRFSDDIMNTADAPLLELLSAVHAIPGIERIRMGSLEPRLMSEAFVSRIAALPKICPHFHLSLQSGCAATLKRMNRHYTPDEYRQSCARLRRYYENPAITTDVIVGFPGETEAEFAESRAFIEEIGFYELHVFKYSRRAGTRADRMDGQVLEGIKEARSRELLLLAEQMSHAYRSQFLGKELSLLCEELEEADGRSYAAGYSREYIRCRKPCSADAFVRSAVVSGTAAEICKEKEVYETLILR